MYRTDFTVRGRRTRTRIGRATQGYTERFATELWAKMLLGHALPAGGKSSEMSLPEVMEKSFQVSSSNNAPRAVEKERLALRLERCFSGFCTSQRFIEKS